MSKALFSLYRPGAGPAREQNLFISLSKHLYCLADGSLKYQKKPIDPRIPGKRLITRFVLLDTDTGTVYGECHTENSCKDLAGFLARAWSKKADHPMRGFPAVLNVPQIVRKDANYQRDIELIARLTETVLGDLPSGFAAGVHAVKQFEKAVDSLFWRVRDGKAPTLFFAQACSAILSVEASDTFAHSWNEKWEAVVPPTSEFLAAVDRLYETSGAWRLEPFDLALNGLPK